MRQTGWLAQHWARALPHGRQGIVSFCAMLAGFGLVVLGCHWTAHGPVNAFLVAPMGASAVLLFGAPQSPLSQPWNLMASHFFGALIGVTCARYLPGDILPAAMALAGVLMAMHFFHCMHPPAGATALFAVIGGPAIHALGYGYVFTPVMVDVLFILVSAICINNLVAGRKYPVRPLADAAAGHSSGKQAAIPLARQCRDIMQPCRLVLPATDSAAHAWQTMMRLRIGQAPVVNEAGTLVGMVSITDLLRSSLLHPPVRNMKPGTAAPVMVAQADVARCMRSDLTPLLEDSPVGQAVALLAQKGATLLPVTDARGEPRGLVTRHTLFSLLAGSSDGPRKAA